MRSSDARPLIAAALTIALVAAMPAVAFAAAVDSPAIGSGKLPGVFAGAILAALIVYALWLLARPLPRDGAVKRVLLLLSGLLILKAFALQFFTGFSVDIGTYEAWALKIATQGPARAYQEGYFLDYPPGYLYALWAAGAFANAVGAGLGETLKAIVEMPPLIGDLALSVAVYLFVRRTASARSAWIALALVALNPAFLFDSVVWGQTDSPLALALFLSIAMLIDGEFEVAWALAALAVLIKPQAFSLLPPIAVWTLLRMPPQPMVARCARLRRHHRDRRRAVPDRPSMDLVSPALLQRRRLLQRNFRQRLQPDGADWRPPRPRFAHPLRSFLLRDRDEHAGAALSLRRLDTVAPRRSPQLVVRLVPRDIRLLHARAPHARTLFLCRRGLRAAPRLRGACDARRLHPAHAHLPV